MSRLQELQAVWSKTAMKLTRDYEMCLSAAAEFGQALRTFLGGEAVHYFSWRHGEPSDRLSLEDALEWLAPAAIVGVSVNVTDRLSRFDAGYRIRLEPAGPDVVTLATPLGAINAIVDHEFQSRPRKYWEPQPNEVTFNQAKLPVLLEAIFADLKGVTAGQGLSIDGHGRKIRCS